MTWKVDTRKEVPNGVGAEQRYGDIFKTTRSVFPCVNGGPPTHPVNYSYCISRARSAVHVYFQLIVHIICQKLYGKKRVSEKKAYLSENIRKAGSMLRSDCPGICLSCCHFLRFQTHRKNFTVWGTKRRFLCPVLMHLKGQCS